ncbi:hypothetical protein HPB48_005197 [Haemaphysalis longicornis]|uniref:Uncharacterized protein n=1 Tax=Haemaphysalis longicornis TaxID=44386 RepID=A0A9J6FF27_HAELO|nr:hypothetical protein HPB48_005197 [Haemaphysalis longicornis]
MNEDTEVVPVTSPQRNQTKTDPQQTPLITSQEVMPPDQRWNRQHIYAQDQVTRTDRACLLRDVCAATCCSGFASVRELWTTGGCPGVAATSRRPSCGSVGAPYGCCLLHDGGRVGTDGAVLCCLGWRLFGSGPHFAGGRLLGLLIRPRHIRAESSGCTDVICQRRRCTCLGWLQPNVGLLSSSRAGRDLLIITTD